MPRRKKNKNITKSLRMTPEVVEMIELGAKGRDMSFSDFITYCVKKELTGNDAVSPDMINLLEKELETLRNTLTSAETLCNTLKNKVEYSLTSNISEVLEAEKEEKFKNRLSAWMKNSVDVIHQSTNREKIGNALIREGIDVFGLTDYGVSILENAIDPDIPIRNPIHD